MKRACLPLVEVSPGKVVRGYAKGVSTSAQVPTLCSMAPVAMPDLTYRSKLEQRYAQELDAMRHAGEIQRWWFEPIKFNLAAKTTYTPDFLVLTKDGKLVFHEVKGFMRDDAAVKLKVCAALYPFAEFLLITRRRSMWIEKKVGA